jgi:uncharacterized protein YbcI
MSPEETSDPRELASTISKEMVRIHTDSYGQSARSAKTYILDNVVLSLIEIELLPSEKLLVESGRHELVREVRQEFQEAIRASFKAAVERATGRTVIAFVSATHIDPAFEVELFTLDAPTGNELGSGRIEGRGAFGSPDAGPG